MEYINDLLDVVCKIQIHLSLLHGKSDKIIDVSIHKIITNVVHYMSKSFFIDVTL